MSAITYDRATLVYPGAPRPSVDALDLSIADGEFLVLVGPSGCGKSTSLRMLAGLEEVTGGSIRIGDQDVTRLPPKERDIAMVFQNYALYPHMTVADNMGFALKIAGMPKEERLVRVREAAKLLDLEQYLDRKPKALSGGQRQRVAMGRAIVRQPQVFLMDEPLSNLDAKLRVQTRTEIAALQRRLGTTTVYVTHDQVEAMTMGDRVAVLKDGVLQQVDTPRNLYDRPANQFVAGFIGSPAMNLVSVPWPRAGRFSAGTRCRCTGRLSPSSLGRAAAPRRWASGPRRSSSSARGRGSPSRSWSWRSSARTPTPMAGCRPRRPPMPRAACWSCGRTRASRRPRARSCTSPSDPGRRTSSPRRPGCASRMSTAETPGA